MDADYFLLIVQTYSKSSMSLLQVDAHFTVVESALKGYKKWSLDSESSIQQRVGIVTASLVNLLTNSWEHERSTFESNLQSWCERLLAVDFEVSYDDCVLRRLN